MEENMDFPLKNKESLDSKDTYRVSKFKYRFAIASAVIGLLTTAISVVAPLVKDVMISDQNQLLRRAKEEAKVQHIIDSIQEINDRAIQEQTYRNISKINELMNELRSQLPNSASISLYYTHDSGGVPVSGSPLNVTILYAANNKEPCLGKYYWQDKPLPDGYFHYNRRLFEQKFSYIPDLGFDELIMNDPTTKEDLECNGTKSMMGIVLKETGTGVYFISVGWRQTDPVLNNFSARLILRKYAAHIEPLIQGRKR